MKKKHLQKKCPRLGVFTTWFYGHYQFEIISGIEEEARRRNVQIIYFSGRSLQSPLPYENDHNIIYDTAFNASLDGLIIMSLLANYCDDSAITEFLSRYKNIPVITINFRSSVGNAIFADNKPGFSTLLQHLTEKHNYRKIAFVKGPEWNLDAIERYEIYKSTLSAKGIDLNPALVTEGYYTFRAGQEAVKYYLDKQGLQPGRDIEVIVCANDAIALGVIDELYERGLHVPHDIAVTGFDNMNESIFPKFPLTTVRQHLHEIGSRAVVNSLDYQTDREPLFFETELVIRSSCGCLQPEAAQQSASHRDFIVYKKDLEFIYYEITRIIDNLKDLQKLTEFADWMQGNFPILGITSAWLFLFSEDPSFIRTYRLLAGYDLQEPAGIKPEDKIPENKIFENILYKRPDRFYCLIPLMSKEEKYGLLVIEVNRMTSFVYDPLGSHIGSSIKNILIGEKMTAMNRQLIESNTLLREANEKKTLFFINVAHETRTPLTLIQNYLERYMDQHDSDESLLIVKQNIDLLLANMLNLLDVEKLQKGNIIYQNDTLVDLSESVRKKCALFLGVAVKKNIRIESNMESNIHIRIDPWALDRILNNLLDNAVKYTQEGGLIKLDAVCRKGRAVLRVCDNGPGLPADTYEHIFEPYYLLSKRKSGQQGIGVGLSIVKKIIDGLGASIKAEKRRGGGTCFTITFPDGSTGQEQGMIQKIPETAPSPLVQISIKERNIAANKHTLFIIDDNTQLLSFLQSALEKSYNVFLARDAAEALSKISTIPRPALIISDIMMDGTDGFQLLTSLSAKEGYNDIPFIFLTALDGDKEKIRGLNLGAVDYIEKPFSLSALTAKIESIIALRRRQETRQVIHIRKKIEKLLFNSEESRIMPLEQKFKLLYTKHGLTGREQEIVRLLIGGLVHKEIASHMNLSLRAVEYHIAKIYKKCGVTNKYELLNKFLK